MKFCECADEGWIELPSLFETYGRDPEVSRMTAAEDIHQSYRKSNPPVPDAWLAAAPAVGLLEVDDADY